MITPVKYLVLIFIVVIAITIFFPDSHAIGMERTDFAEQSWTHTVGRNHEEVTKEIQSRYPSLKVHVVKQNAMVTMDFRTDRVRVFVDDEGKVVREPHLVEVNQLKKAFLHILKRK